ncbi:hypothetical protein [Dictyobacter formicarum]|uniref:DUF4240 domain-containing protein n=1 Tax=Dictyobacter formicarum TaxID=2778368 RepID=A0ABQ3VFU8_9CHLR|nr:hypothetical protein [Dictyobacter formicarum]GHO84660.1 hypothetical protein KSZ_26660 [Dictyobacter formicarum]
MHVPSQDYVSQNRLPLEYGTYATIQYDAVERAFCFCYLNGWEYDLHQFYQCWRNCSIETCLHILFHGSIDDKCVAICVIAWSGYEHTQTVLAPFLESSSPKERWCATFCLKDIGMLQHHSVLCHMLTEFLPSKDNPMPLPIDDLLWFDVRRYWVILALRDVPTIEVAPSLRKALIQQIEAEYYMTYVQSYAHYFEDSICYELGFRGVFGAIAGMELRESYRDLFYANMAVGCYDSEVGMYQWYGTDAIEPLMYENKYRRHLNRIMNEKFGLDEEVANGICSSYYDNVDARNALSDLDKEGRIKQRGQWSDD